jgi:hypothetical protein
MPDDRESADKSASGGLASVRASVVGAIGPRAVHAAEDGLTAGALVGLAVTVPRIAGLLAAALAGVPSRAGPLALIREIPEIIRGDNARAQESYFIVAFLLGAVVGVIIGGLLPPVPK